MKRTLVVLGVALTTAVAIEQLRTPSATHYEPPMTPWGEPDLQGTYTSDGFLGVPFERPSWLGDRPTLTDAEFAAREKANREQIARDKSATPVSPFGADSDANNAPEHWIERGTTVPRAASLVIDPPDGRIPPLTADGQHRREDARQRALRRDGTSAAAHSHFDRCITRGVVESMLPDISGGSGTNLMQGPGVVVIRNEMIHEARIVPIDGTAPRLGPKIHLYMGDPRGHWEGSTLVVDSTNFTDRLGVGGGTVASTGLHLVEKFTRTAADTIHYEFTVDDLATFTARWTAALDLRSTPGYEIYEYACHEGNYALRNMLSASRADERAAGSR